MLNKPVEKLDEKENDLLDRIWQKICITYSKTNTS